MGDGAKGTEIVDKFLQSTPFQDGVRPRVVAVHAVQNDTLSRLHEEYRMYLRNKNKEEPSVRELYHGTNNKILEVLYRHGLQPPSDMQASEACPVSGGKGLCTSLCNNDCKHCVERHEWTGATCSAWVSTWRTSRKNPTGIVRSLRCCRTAAGAFAWCSALCWVGHWSWRA